MPTSTLAELRALVAKAADIDVGTSERHTTAQVTARVNLSLQAYQSCLVDAGHSQRETRATATTSASESVSNGWPANHYVALPADFLSLLAAKIVPSSSGQEFMLKPLPETHSDLITEWSETGLPLYYRLSENTAGTKILKLYPPADAAYTIVTIYTPQMTALSADGDTYNFFPGTSDYVVCDAAMWFLEADGVQEGGQYNALARRRDEALYRLKEYAHRQNRAGPPQIRDVRRRTHRLGYG